MDTGTVKSVYAFRNRADILELSSSGGAFTAICEIVINNNGVVYGAAFNSDLKVVHQRAETLEECKKFMGSKYVQSDMRGICSQIAEELQKERIVLFSGTPCQIYSVKQFCHRNEISMTKLILVDIICHGTVSPMIWEKYKQWIENKYKSKIVEFNFRYKKVKSKSYPVFIRFENGKTIVNTHTARLYTNLFLSGVSLRESCFHCQFANLNRQSDLSIGDFWGIENVMPDFPADKGVSEILVNTEKGEWLLQEIQKKERVKLEKCLSDEFLFYQHNLNCPTQRVARVEQFRKDCASKDFSYILKVYAGNNIKGITYYWLKRLAEETGLYMLLAQLRKMISKMK